MKKAVSYQPYKLNFKETKFPGESWSYIAPSWEEMGRIYLNLGAAILKNEEKFDALVTLAKGGWTWSRTMADILEISEIHSFKLSLYDASEPGKIMEKPRLDLPLTANLSGKKVLFFDDVNDTGKSLYWSLRYLEFYNPGKVVTATLFHKPHSKFNPNYYGYVTSTWIIFPHERREGVVGLAKKWLKQGLEIKKIKNRLIEIGIPKKEIDLFLNIEGL